MKCLIINIVWLQLFTDSCFLVYKTLQECEKLKKTKKHLLELKISTCKCLKPFDIHFTLTEDKEMQQISTFKTQNSLIFCLKNYWNYWSNMKIVQLSVIFYPLIDGQIVATLKYRLSIRNFMTLLTPRDMSATDRRHY